MNSNIEQPEHHIKYAGHAYFRKNSELACAPLLAAGGVDWDSWTIVEELPITEKDEIRDILKRLKFDEKTATNVMTSIAWY